MKRSLKIQAPLFECEEKTMKWLERICGLVTALAAELWIVFLVLYEGVLNTGFLMWRYNYAYHTAEALHMTEQELRDAVRNVIRLMKGRSVEYEFTSVVRGETVTFLNPKEIHHVKELAELLGKARGLVLTAAILAVLSIAFLRYRQRFGKDGSKINAAKGKKKASKRVRFAKQEPSRGIPGLLQKRLAEGILSSFAVIVMAGLAMGAAALINLRGFVIFLHEIFFKGESWILNPAVDRLIHLCPMGIFVDGMIALAVGMTAFVLLAICFCRRNRTRVSKEE